jgi:hypothetical protein
MGKEKLDQFHNHELLDRLHVTLSYCDSFLLDHPVAQSNKKIKKKLSKAISILSEAYQLAGEL